MSEKKVRSCDICDKIISLSCGEILNDGDIFICNDCLSRQTKYDCDECVTSYDDCPFGKEYSYCYDCEEYREKGENE
jgi:hypothetical protein